MHVCEPSHVLVSERLMGAAQEVFSSPQSFQHISVLFSILEQASAVSSEEQQQLVWKDARESDSCNIIKDGLLIKGSANNFFCMF